VVTMSRSRSNPDVWDDIFDDLVLESEPPIRYIKDAVIVTKSGARFKVSAEDYAEIVAREKNLTPDQSDIMSCSLSIDFARIKRDVNRYATKMLAEIEVGFPAIEIKEKAKRASKRAVSNNRKVD